MTTRNSKLTLRILLALVLSTGLLWTQWPLESHGSASAADLNLKSESQVRSEAALYDTAIREISRLAELKLATPENSKTAQGVIAKQAPNLKFGRSKLIALGLSDTTFTSAVKAQGSDKKSLDQFTQALAKDPNSILKLNGASALADRMRSSSAADIAQLQKVAALLKQAGVDMKAKAHHAISTRSVITSPGAETALLPVGLSNDDVVVLVIVVAVIAYPPLGVALVALAGIVLAVELAAGAALLIGRLIENGGTEKGRDKVADCLDRVDSKRRSCESEANDLPFPINIAASDACAAQWLLDAGVCLIS